MKETSSIDLFRKEERFFLPVKKFKLLKKVVKDRGFTEKKFSGKNKVQTVYLFDDNQTWSIGISIKARRYISRFSELLSLSDMAEKQYLFEIKREVESETEGIKEKSPRIAVDLKKAVEIARKQFKDVRPYMVVEYERMHFIQKEIGQNMRLTLDTNTRFWFFPSDKSAAVCIKRSDSEESIVRIETKIDPRENPSCLINEITNDLKKLGSQAVISKKQEGLNAVKHWYDSYCANSMDKELGNCEIESKFNLAVSDVNILFSQLVNFFRKNTFPIIVDRVYPFTFTTASVNHYWKRADDESLSERVKLLSRGMSSRIVLKSNLKIVDTKCNIIERKEKKEKRFIFSGDSYDKIVTKKYDSTLGPLKYTGYLKRSRKAIWLRNEDNGRIYHISIDKCTTDNKLPLYQIEVEYSGRIKSDCSKKDCHDLAKNRKDIIEDIKFITEKIFSFAKLHEINLHPGEEKFQWLIS